jgi:AbiJ N-terminal domain 4
MSFSQRMGLKPIREIIQSDDIDTPLKNALWDCLHLCIWLNFENEFNYGQAKDSNLELMTYQLWHRFFHLPIDSMPDHFDEVVEHLRKFFFSCTWNECYDLIEFCVEYAPEGMHEALKRMVNRVLEDHLSAYRVVENEISPITTEEEIKSIEAAIDNQELNSGARAHLCAALSMLSDRRSPDYRNSIKESISAVEAVCQQLVGNESATLGQALKRLEQNGEMHQALKAALSSLYGYTSDSDGIRHAMLEEPSVSFADAKFMLVVCTAFVNYMIDKTRT